MSESTSSLRSHLDGVEEIVGDPLHFKAKLAIGENAYTSLRAFNRVRDLWEAIGAAGTGAAVAQSSIVASTFFAPSGLLGVLGIGTAATPIGWVAFAAIASGGACYGLYRLLGRGIEARVIEIPRYINTPLDALGLALFDLLAPIAIRLSAVDGTVSDAERDRLSSHLVGDWGFDPTFVRQALVLIEPEAATGSLDLMASEAASFLHSNPDCNHAEIAKEYVEFLRELLETDGALTADEQAALDMVSTRLRTAPDGPLMQHWMTAKEQAGLVSDQVKETLVDAAQWAKENVTSRVTVPFDTSKAVDRARDTASVLKRQVGDAAEQVSRSTRTLLGKIIRRG
jgi:hypothetical protein